jgi:sodium-dependent phosphate transporter
MHTTHTHQGVGLAEGRKGAVKWSQLAKMAAGWVFTLLVGGLLSAAIFSWGTYAPNKQYGADILQYQNSLTSMTNAQLKAMNAAPGTAPPELATLNSQW